MPTSIKAAFRPVVVRLKVSCLFYSKELDERARRDQKYRQIAASLRTVGLIEPLVVFPFSQRRFRVLDGNKRLDILSRQKVPEIECIIATENEAYTYNKRVNYLSPVGEHDMILKAIAHNSIQRIATALAVSIETIRRKRNMLEGICEEAIEVLKDRRVAPKAFVALRKMKAVRQVEAAELMTASNNYSGRFAAALVAGTRVEMLVKPDKPQMPSSVTIVQRMQMENETDALMTNIKAVEQTYGSDVLALSVYRRYMDKLLGNARVRDYISRIHPEICRELESLLATLQSEQIRVPVPKRLAISAATPKTVRTGSRSRKARLQRDFVAGR